MGQRAKAPAPGGAAHDELAMQEVIAKVSSTVSGITGVQLGERQRSMIESRVKRRMSELGLNDFNDYLSYLGQNFAAEREVLVALLTTHHTYFFREFSQFEILEQRLPDLVARVTARGDNTLRIWSAACSRGQEVYSLAMFLDQVLPRVAPGLKYEIFGSDVDPESVSIARNGVYHRREIKDVPMLYLADHWVKGKGEIEEFVKARSALRTHCTFDTVNLLDFRDKMHARRFDVIFCRNVFIYFTPERVRAITLEFLKHLEPHGQIYIGISESFNGLDVPLKPLGPSVYGRKDFSTPASARAQSIVTPTAKAAAGPISSPGPTLVSVPQKLRVLCVDDSPSILGLLKRVLSADHGFEVVATAENGLDAAKKVAEFKPDLLTMDIHMPQQSGIEYLAASFGPTHPPVVMVSSVSRENADLAVRALALGASDYIEKPALNNLTDRGEEIRVKLKCAWRSKTAVKHTIHLDKAFGHHQLISGCEKKLRVAFAGLSDRSRLSALFKEIQKPQPPTVIVLEGTGEVIHQLAQWLSSDIKTYVEHLQSGGSTLRNDGIYIADFSQLPDLVQSSRSKSTSILVYGEMSKHAANAVKGWVGANILVEDLGGGKATQGLETVASDIVPVTSFAYMSSEYLARRKA